MRILLVEDNPGDARLVREYLGESAGGFTIAVAERLGEGLENLVLHGADAVLLDMNLPDSRGLDTLTGILSRFPRLPVIVMTSTTDEALAVRSLQMGAQDYLVKGRVDAELLRHTLVYAIERKKLELGIAERNVELETANAALRESQERFRTLSEASPVLISVGGAADGTMLYANRAYREAFGFAEGELEGKRAVDLYSDPVDRDAIIAELKRLGRIKNREVRVRRRDGSEMWVSANISHIRFEGAEAVLGTSIDITDRKRAERALQTAREHNARQEKLAAIGRVAGGVAHELRNPLAAIKNAAYFLAMSVGESDSDVASTLDILNKEITRSENIISSLLSLTHQDQRVQENVDINRILEGELHNMSCPGIKIESHLDASLPALAADPAMLSIIFKNLIKNACEAMPSGGRLNVNTSGKGDWVVIDITDSGPGIPGDVMSRLFEPFFTTKPWGTGLGLAMVKTLVESHGGTVEVESMAGRGSTFTVRLQAGKRPEGA